MESLLRVVRFYGCVPNVLKNVAFSFTFIVDPDVLQSKRVAPLLFPVAIEFNHFPDARTTPSKSIRADVGDHVLGPEGGFGIRLLVSNDDVVLHWLAVDARPVQGNSRVPSKRDTVSEGNAEDEVNQAGVILDRSFVIHEYEVAQS